MSKRKIASKTERKYKHPQLADRTVNQHGDRKCLICSKTGTKVPHDIDGRERWTQVDEHGHEWVCHACYHKKESN